MNTMSISHMRKSTRARTGRPRQWAENMVARFPAGTFKRIKKMLGKDEDRTDFVREAVERELKRRKRQNAEEEA